MIKFGTFTQMHTRTEQSDGLQYEFGHYTGQMVITDGQYCLALDDYWANMKPEVLAQYFERNKELNLNSPVQLPHIDWFEKTDMPIEWHSDHKNAFINRQNRPDRYTISHSYPIKNKSELH